MGTWDCNSYSNDRVMDLVRTFFPSDPVDNEKDGDNSQQGDIAGALRMCNEMLAENRTEDQEQLAFGLVIWTLKQGISYETSIETLSTCKAAIQGYIRRYREDDEDIESYGDPAKRADYLDGESRLIERAIQNGGQLPTNDPERAKPQPQQQTAVRRAVRRPAP